MLREQLVVEACLGREGVVDVAVEVDGDEAAAVVGAERDLAARVGAQGLEAQVGIAVGDGLADDGVPKHHARLSRLPSIVDDLVPQGAGIHHFGVFRVGRVDGVLLRERLAFLDALHELVGEAHRDVGVGDAPLGHLGIDESLRVGVLDADGHHQGPSTAVLGHLFRRIREAFHERHYAGRGQGAVLHRTARGTEMRQVVTHAATTFH